MELKTPPEPLDIKRDLKSARSGDTPSNWDRLAVWVSGLPKYLWDNWKGELKRAGYTWQKFSGVLSLHTNDFIEWGVYERLSWNELVARVMNTLREHTPKPKS